MKISAAEKELAGVVGKNIRHAIIDANTTASQVCRVLGYTSNKFSFWSQGRRCPSLYELKRIAELLDTSVSYLIGEL